MWQKPAHWRAGEGKGIACTKLPRKARPWQCFGTGKKGDLAKAFWLRVPWDRRWCRDYWKELRFYPNLIFFHAWNKYLLNESILLWALCVPGSVLSAFCAFFSESSRNSTRSLLSILHMQNPKLRVPWPRSLSQLLVKPGQPNSTVWAHNPPCYHLLMYSTDRLSSYYMPGTVLGDRNTDGLYPPGSYVPAGATANVHLCTYKDIITL